MANLRRVLGLVALVAAVAPASASATEWFYERQPIPKGTTVEVPSQGANLKLNMKWPKVIDIRMACSAKGVTAIWNGPENGFDEVRSISFACKSESGGVVLRPRGTWTSKLVGTSLPLTDDWSGVELEVIVRRHNYGVFAGSLTPTQGDSDSQAGNDDLDAELRFHGETLSGPNGAVLSFNGAYHLGPSRGHGATGEV